MRNYHDSFYCASLNDDYEIKDVHFLFHIHSLIATLLILPWNRCLSIKTHGRTCNKITTISMILFHSYFNNNQKLAQHEKNFGKIIWGITQIKYVKSPS